MDLTLPSSSAHIFHSSIQVTPLTSACENSFRSSEHICFGISPFNSLFSEDYISNLISWGQVHFKSVSLFLPDEPTFYTLEALGYSEDECRKKMKKQLNWLRNKINKALSNNGLCPTKNSVLLDWQTLSTNKAFNKSLDEVYQLFDSDTYFRNQCLEASRWVLQNKLEESMIDEKTLLKAVKYFLSELPLFAATNEITGHETSLFCYHQAIDFHEKFYAHELSFKPAIGQGYGVIHSSH